MSCLKPGAERILSIRSDNRTEGTRQSSSFSVYPPINFHSVALRSCTLYNTLDNVSSDENTLSFDAVSTPPGYEPAGHSITIRIAPAHYTSGAMFLSVLESAINTELERLPRVSGYPPNWPDNGWGACRVTANDGIGQASGAFTVVIGSMQYGGVARNAWYTTYTRIHFEVSTMCMRVIDIPDSGITVTGSPQFSITTWQGKFYLGGSNQLRFKCVQLTVGGANRRTLAADRSTTLFTVPLVAGYGHINHYEPINLSWQQYPGGVIGGNIVSYLTFTVVDENDFPKDIQGGYILELAYREFV